MATETVKRKVTSDVYVWTTVREGTNPPQTDYHRASRGAVVELPREAAERGDELGMLTDPDNEVRDPVGVTSSAAPPEQVARTAGVMTADGRPTVSPGTLNPRPDVLIDPAAAGAGAVTTTMPGATIPAAGGAPMVGAQLAADVAASAGLTPEGQPVEGSDAAEPVRTDTPPAPEATGPAAATSDVSDDAFRTMNAEDVVAHLNQYPGDVERVAAVEGERSTQRVTVQRAIETHRQAS